VRGICEGVEYHLWSSDSRPAYRGIRTLKAHWDGYFERL